MTLIFFSKVILEFSSCYNFLFFFFFSIITGKLFVLWPQRQGALGKLGNLLFSERDFQRKFECIMNCENVQGFLPLSHSFCEYPALSRLNAKYRDKTNAAVKLCK